MARCLWDRWVALRPRVQLALAATPMALGKDPKGLALLAQGGRGSMTRANTVTRAYCMPQDPDYQRQQDQPPHTHPPCYYFPFNPFPEVCQLFWSIFPNLCRRAPTPPLDTTFAGTPQLPFWSGWLPRASCHLPWAEYLASIRLGDAREPAPETCTISESDVTFKTELFGESARQEGTPVAR